MLYLGVWERPGRFRLSQPRSSRPDGGADKGCSGFAIQIEMRGQTTKRRSVEGASRISLLDPFTRRHPSSTHPPPCWRPDMLWNIAYRTLLYDRGKLLAGLVGVIFSVVLVNIQGGLFLGLMNKARLLVDRSHADIWVGHRGMHNVDFPHEIPERWIHRIRSIPGVLEAEPLRIYQSEMNLPDGNFEGVTVVGVKEDSSAWPSLRDCRRAGRCALVCRRGDHRPM